MKNVYNFEAWKKHLLKKAKHLFTRAKLTKSGFLPCKYIDFYSEKPLTFYADASVKES